MVEFKVVIGDVKSGKCHQKVVPQEETKTFYNKKIGDKIKGDILGLTGYEFEITGGSDNCGFPMRRDIDSARRKRILSTRTTGLKIKRKGMRKRKNFAGNTISERTAQINLKVIKYGSKKLQEAPAKEETTKKEEPEAKTEESKPEQAKEKKEETNSRDKESAAEEKTTKKEKPKTEEKAEESKKEKQ